MIRGQLSVVEPPALTETDLAAFVLDGKADCGVAIRAVDERFRLDFIPLHIERFDLAMRRRGSFRPPGQGPFAVGRGRGLAAQPAGIGG